jgi:hypothetical protein
METAVRWLRAPEAAAASRRHILLVSDGRTDAADAAQLKRAVQGTGIHVSVVALGADADRALLQDVAASTGGRAIFPGNVRELPLLLAREASRTASGWRVGESFVPRASTHPVVGPLANESLARLSGYVVGAARGTAEVPVRSHLDDPVLAIWTVGLGRVMTSTVDLRTARGGAAERSNVQTIWMQAIRHVLRWSEDPVLTVNHELSAEGMRVVVDAIAPSGAFVNQLDIRADIRGPDGNTRSTVLHQVAPGRYEAAVDLIAAGAYATQIRARDAAGTFDRRLLRGIYRTSSESRATGVDHERLRAIAAATGGRVLDANARPFTEDRPTARAELWPWLVSFALVLFFLEAIEVPRLLRDALVRQRRKHAQAPSAV